MSLIQLPNISKFLCWMRLMKCYQEASKIKSMTFSRNYLVKCRYGKCNIPLMYHLQFCNKQKLALLKKGGDFVGQT